MNKKDKKKKKKKQRSAMGEEGENYDPEVALVVQFTQETAHYFNKNKKLRRAVAKELGLKNISKARTVPRPVHWLRRRP